MSVGKRAKIIIVSFQYWPALSARSFRWTALAEQWASEGSEVHVVCSGSSVRPEVETVNGVRVHRVGGAWIERLRASESTSAVSGGSSGPGAMRRAASAAARRIWHAIYWPDTSCTWYWAARRKASELVAAVGPDALVSVSPTFTAVAVGRALRRSGEGKFRWLMDLGDPFSFSEEAPPNNFRLYRRLNLAFERACFAAADCVSVTTLETRDRYAALFPESAGKIAVIPPLVALPEPSRDAPVRSAARRLVYLGRLYPTIRRPDFLLQLFAALAEARPSEGYELHLYGETRECEASFVPYAHLVGRSIHLHGSVPRERAAAAMRSADVLVNLANDTQYQLPSKVVEYATTGKPILNIARYRDDSSARFLADYPPHLTLLAREDGPAPEDLARLQVFLSHPPQAIAPELLRARLAAYTLPAISARYGALMSG